MASSRPRIIARFLWDWTRQLGIDTALLSISSPGVHVGDTRPRGTSANDAVAESRRQTRPDSGSSPLGHVRACSGFLRHVERASATYDVNVRSILEEVGGREDMIVDLAANLWPERGSESSAAPRGVLHAVRGQEP
jgi:DmpG-like communication domain